MEQTYTLNCIETDDEHDQEVTREFGTSGDIQSTLSHMRDFLVACGFTYVTQLVAVVDNGVEFSSDSI